MKAFTVCCLVLAAFAAVESAPNGYSAPSSSSYSSGPAAAPAYSAPAVDYLEVPADQPVPIYPSLLNDNFLPSYQAPLTFLPPVYAVVSGTPPVDSPLYVELPAHSYSAPASSGSSSASSYGSPASSSSY